LGALTLLLLTREVRRRRDPEFPVGVSVSSRQSAPSVKEMANNKKPQK